MSHDRITTFTGKPVNPFELKPADIDIRDIAHSLALTNRFVGHSREPYSVAEHSVRVSGLCRPQDALTGLLHDASEAYLGDVATPTKLQWSMTLYRHAETRAMKVIGDVFGVSNWQVVKEIDEKLCATEAYCLFDPAPQWAIDRPTFDIVIEPWSWWVAEKLFLKTFYRLMKGRVAA